jgi:RNA polymerase sigma factor (sigma-70 family)
MSDKPDEFEALMRRVREGCPHAAREAVERFSPHVRRVVRRKLDPRLRDQFDSVDFMQSVWVEFFDSPARDKPFTSPARFIGFLARLARCKVINAYRRQFGAAKRGPQRADVPVEGPEMARDHRGHTPSQVVMAREQWEHLLASQPPQFRVMLELLRQGHTHDEIAARLGLNPKSVQRFLRRLTHNVGEP